MKPKAIVFSAFPPKKWEDQFAKKITEYVEILRLIDPTRTRSVDCDVSGADMVILFPQMAPADKRAAVKKLAEKAKKPFLQLTSYTATWGEIFSGTTPHPESVRVPVTAPANEVAEVIPMSSAPTIEGEDIVFWKTSADLYLEEVQALEHRVRDLDAQMQAANQVQQDIGAQRDQLTSRVRAQTDSLNELSRTIGELQKQLDAKPVSTHGDLDLRRQLSELRVAKTRAEGQITTLSQQLIGMQETVRGLEQAKDDLARELEAARARPVEAEARHREQLTAAKLEADSIRTELATKRNLVEERDQKIRSLNEQITALERQAERHAAEAKSALAKAQARIAELERAAAAKKPGPMRMTEPMKATIDLLQRNVDAGLMTPTEAFTKMLAIVAKDPG